MVNRLLKNISPFEQHSNMGNSMNSPEKNEEKKVLKLNNLTHINFDQIATHKNLRALYMDSVTGGDLTPISECKLLTTLYLNSFVGDIEPISKMVNLKSLNLNAIEDISSLKKCIENCKFIETLYIDSYNGDLEMFTTLPLLRCLHIGSYTGDLTQIQHFPNLQNLFLDSYVGYEGSLESLIFCKKLKKLRIPSYKFNTDILMKCKRLQFNCNPKKIIYTFPWIIPNTFKPKNFAIFKVE